MSGSSAYSPISRRLLALGIALFLLGLLTGLVTGALANPRMGVSAHLEGVLNGVFLIALSSAWRHIHLPKAAETTAFWLLAYGTTMNWAATLAAAAWGTSGMTPIAGAGHQGTAAHEMIIRVALLSLTAAMIVGVALLLWGVLAHRK